MAFGQTLKEPAKRATTDGEQVTFEWQWLNTSNGIRRFRILPELTADRSAIATQPATDPVGRKKEKQVTMPETEVRWLEAWWPVIVGGSEQKRRLILDPNHQWDNPLWKYIQKHFEKGSQERKAIKQRFGVNVLDMTPVLFDSNGNVVYPDINNVYNISAMGKRVETLTGNPEPLNRVRIFEGSAGDLGGKHLFQQVVDVADGLEDNDGNAIGLHEVTLILKTQGEGIKTTRGIRQSSDFSTLADQFIFAPRYDIAGWAKAWPDEMIEALLAGEDFNDLVEQYNIKLFPELYGATVESDVETEEPVKTTRKKASKKTDDDEALFDD